MPIPLLERDEEKRRQTLANRAIDFADCGALWDGRPIIEQQDPRHVDEARYRRYGRLHGRLLLVVWTPRDAAVRIISVRPAGRREQREIGSRIPYIWRVSEPRPTGAAMATDWTRVDATTDEDIARWIAEDPDTAPELTEEMLLDADLVVNGIRRPLAEVMREAGTPLKGDPLAKPSDYRTAAEG